MSNVNALPVLISRQRLQARVEQLAAKIAEDFERASTSGDAVGLEHPRLATSLVLVCVLKGSFVFAADLARALKCSVRLEFLGVRSYGASTRSSGVVQLTQDLTQPIAGEHVLVVEDIVDTGLTCHYLLQLLKARSPASVRLCSLLHKPARCQVPVEIDYLGFTVDDVFVVGYGLDHAERYRELPDICLLPPPPQPS